MECSWRCFLTLSAFYASEIDFAGSSKMMHYIVWSYITLVTFFTFDTSNTSITPMRLCMPTGRARLLISCRIIKFSIDTNTFLMLFVGSWLCYGLFEDALSGTEIINVLDVKWWQDVCMKSFAFPFRIIEDGHEILCNDRL